MLSFFSVWGRGQVWPKCEKFHTFFMKASLSRVKTKEIITPFYCLNPRLIISCYPCLLVVLTPYSLSPSLVFSFFSASFICSSSSASSVSFTYFAMHPWSSPPLLRHSPWKEGKVKTLKNYIKRPSSLYILPRTPLAMLSAQFGEIGNSRRKRRKNGSSWLLSSSLSLNLSTLSGT